MGQYTTISDQAHRFVTGAGGQGISDVSYSGAESVNLLAINASGQVLGYAFGSDSAYAFITGPNGQGLASAGVTGGGYGIALNNLGTLGGNFSRATGINDQGVIVGNSLEPDAYDSSQTTAFVILGEGQDMVSLSSLAIDFDGTFSEAVAVNHAGQILVTNFGRSYLLTPTAIPEAQTSAMLLLGLGGIGWLVKRQKMAHQPQA